jgi:hypothetical protein
MRESPAIREFFVFFSTHHHFLLILLSTTMPPTDEFEENKVQNALALLRENPGMKATVAARQTRALYYRVIRRLNGTPRSLSRGGHNKKLDLPFTKALKEYLLMCHTLGKRAGIDNVISSANSILRCNSSIATVSRKWAKR